MSLKIPICHQQCSRSDALHSTLRFEAALVCSSVLVCLGCHEICCTVSTWIVETVKEGIFEAILIIKKHPLVSRPPLQVILESKTGQAELELFPRYLLFLRQQPATRSPQSNIWVNMGMTSLRMFPSYLPPSRGNVSLQQDPEQAVDKMLH